MFLRNLVLVPPEHRKAVLLLDEKYVSDDEDALPRPKPGRFVRYFLSPVFGFHPREGGEWVSTSPYCRFVERYGPLFDNAKGPFVAYMPGSMEFTDSELGSGSRKVDRGRHVPVTIRHPRMARAVEVAQVLGCTMAAVKLLLFAAILAGLSKGVSPIIPVTLLLCLSLLYFFYIRFLCPLLCVVCLINEVISVPSDLGTFICGIILVATPPSKFNTT